MTEIQNQPTVECFCESLRIQSPLGESRMSHMPLGLSNIGFLETYV